MLTAPTRACARQKSTSGPLVAYLKKIIGVPEDPCQWAPRLPKEKVQGHCTAGRKVDSVFDQASRLRAYTVPPPCFHQRTEP